MDSKMISIIIPVYNEADNVSALAIKIKKKLKKKSYEVLFINDGSQDETENRIKKIVENDRHFSCINFKRNFGQTAALQAGFDYARANYNSNGWDLQNDPDDIQKLIKK